MNARSKRKIKILLSETGSTRSSGNILVLPVGEYSIDMNITTIEGNNNSIVVGIYTKDKMNTVEGHLGSKIYPNNAELIKDWNINNASIRTTVITPTSIDIS